MDDKKKIRVLFYKSKWGDKKWIDNLISLWTWSKYSHVEIWTADENGRFWEDFIFLGTCYTSTMRGEDNGTVKRDASGILDHPWRWDYVEIELTSYQPELLMCIMNLAVGMNQGYALWDLLKFVSPIHFPDNRRNICSEAVNNWLVAAEILDEHGIITPGKLFKKLIKAGYKSKELL